MKKGEDLYLVQDDTEYLEFTKEQIEQLSQKDEEISERILKKWGLPLDEN